MEDCLFCLCHKINRLIPSYSLNYILIPKMFYVTSTHNISNEKTGIE